MPPRPPCPRPVVLLLLAFLAALAAGCAGVIVEPNGYAFANGPTKFWGYAIEPSEPLTLEAQNTSGTWEAISSTTAVTRPTYAGSRTAYYWELTTDPKAIAVRFRRNIQGTTYTVLYRITSPGLSPAETRNGDPTSNRPGDYESWWATYKSDGVVHLGVY